LCDIRIVDLTCSCKPLVFTFYICCFVLVNKHVIYLWCNISWEGSNSSFECRIRSRDPGHAHLAVVLWSGRSRGPSSMTVQNLKRIICIRSKVIRGSHNFDIWSRDPGHAHFGVLFDDPDAVGVRPLCLCQMWSGYLYSFQSYKGVPKFLNSVTWPRPRPLRGHFMVRTPEGCVLDVCTKFESDISIPSKVIRGANVRKLGHVTRATPT